MQRVVIVFIELEVFACIGNGLPITIPNNHLATLYNIYVYLKNRSFT